MRLPSLLLAPLFCLSCGTVPESEPVPNGAFTYVDGGEAVGTERYRFTLPEPLDLDRAQVLRREVEWFPSTALVGYLDLDLPLPSGDELIEKQAEPWSATTLELWLEDAKGDVIFRESARLGEWVWSGAVGGGTTSLYTQKTCFEPAGEGPFSLVAEVIPAAEGAPSGVLGIRGGGWKADGEPMPLSALLR
ncbi:MAG: hypothetical protein ACPGPE_08420 [Planctomycetota bacterium]